MIRDWPGKQRLIKHAFLGSLRETVGCGPFDGGCLIVAQAFHSVIGGGLCVLADKDDNALHAVVLKDGMLWDYDGPMAPAAFLDRYNSFVDDHRYLCVRHRPLEGWDLSEAMENDPLAKRLASMISFILPPHVKTGNGGILSIQRPNFDDDYLDQIGSACG